MVDAVGVLVEVATVVSALLVVAAGIGVIDRVVQGRFRSLLRRYLAIEDVRRQAERNGEKLDALHNDHMETMGAQVAVARSHQHLVELYCDEHDVPADGRPDDIRVEEMARRAAERGATWPGEFTRGSD